MHVEFNYNKGEVLSALRYHFMHRGEIKVFRNTIIIFLLATFAGYFFSLVTIGALTGITIMILVLTWIFWYLLPVSIYNRAATFKDDIRLKFGDDGMLISTGGSYHERTISWNKFSKVVDTKKFIYLYRDKKTFFLIPASAFNSEEQYEGCVRLLKEKIE
ncbi:YcxB-like protein [Chitinophaga jiangningensis]|uniref:YcxB-like protein n=1 Tax=Chitinophaga jiangningensis TaxID=1419482 RepID=A0A1M7DR48_9BACT|nr:YcxB family protein [Chitinophaga jiangningensis]SHL81970.1 YcxB-like protein [Chitinophaga jiangningensis]